MTTVRSVVSVAFAAALTAFGPVTAKETSNEAELANAIGTRLADTPVDCITPQNQRTVQVINGTAIVYDYGSRLYVNRPVEGAETLRRDDVLLTHIYRERLCRLDTITLLDPTSRLPRSVVTLGAFVPYRRPH